MINNEFLLSRFFDEFSSLELSLCICTTMRGIMKDFQAIYNMNFVVLFETHKSY